MDENEENAWRKMQPLNTNHKIKLKIQNMKAQNEAKHHIWKELQPCISTRQSVNVSHMYQEVIVS